MAYNIAVVPIYEYQCKRCTHRFSLLRSFRQMDQPAACPACRHEETMRLLSLFAAHTGKEAGACETSLATGNPCCRLVPGGG